MRRALAGVLTTAYGVCALAVFCLLLVVATVLALVVPSLAWRRRVTHFVAQPRPARSSGVRLVVEGLDRLPPGSCVVVANHASYLDGVVMTAALPPRFSFVIKREAASMPMAGFLLKRIGSEFVDRHTEGGRRRDALRVLRRAEQGHALVVFPEGTFDEVPGLKRFHIGAFAAADARRHAGGAGRHPRHAARAAEQGAARAARTRARRDPRADASAGVAATPATSCGDEARRRMLERLDEPDLAPPQTREG